MKLIIDNNVFFSLMNPSSANSFLFSSLHAIFCAPEFLKDEFTEHKEECLTKSGLSVHEFEMRKEHIETKIAFIPPSIFEKFLEGITLSDQDDVPYVAAGLATHSAIWSN